MGLKYKYQAVWTSDVAIMLGEITEMIPDPYLKYKWTIVMYRSQDFAEAVSEAMKHVCRSFTFDIISCVPVWDIDAIWILVYIYQGVIWY